ncbi:hypothetical protein ACEPPN_000972 [Leptodophora sp. 'Broadleaf-Isolate-01']
MECYALRLSSAFGDREVKRVSHQHKHGDAAGGMAESAKQRRKIQNRKNQRAYRQRIKKGDPAMVSTPSPFKIRRWHLDELDDGSVQDASPALQASSGATDLIGCRRPNYSTATSKLGGPKNLRRSKFNNSVHAWATVYPPTFVFPLSTDHLLHLIQFNVLRAFISNKRTLNLLLTGWTNQPPSTNKCPLSGPYRDDTMVYPLNPNIPFALAPTSLQQTQPHSIWVNFFPFPRIRDNLIMYEGDFDHWELLEDLVGELMSLMPTREKRETPPDKIISGHTPTWTVPLPSGHDEDEVTSDRKGLIVWGEPHDMKSWEATPGFLAKWAWIVEGCDELIDSTNRWRLTRGEEPVVRLESKGTAVWKF